MVAATLARAFIDDPFYSFLAGDAPQPNQRMRSTGGAASFGSDRPTWRRPTRPMTTPGSRSGIPPGHGGAWSIIDSLRMMPAIGLATGWGLAPAAPGDERDRRAAGTTSSPRSAAALLPVGAGGRARSPGRGDRHRADAADPGSEAERDWHSLATSRPPPPVMCSSTSASDSRWSRSSTLPRTRTSTAGSCAAVRARGSPPGHCRRMTARP